MPDNEQPADPVAKPLLQLVNMLVGVLGIVNSVVLKRKAETNKFVAMLLAR